MGPLRGMCTAAEAEAAVADGAEQPQNDMTSSWRWTGAAGPSVPRLSARTLFRLVVSAIAASPLDSQLE